MLRRWLTIVVALGLLAALLAWAFAPRPVAVDTEPAVLGGLAQTVDEEGKTRVRGRYVVSAPLGGRVARITFDEGDPVERNAVVAVISPALSQLLDPRTRSELGERVGVAQANVERAMGARSRATATAAQAAVDLGRTENLMLRGFVSAAQVDRERLALELARREASVAESQVRAAEHELAQARAALAGTAASASRSVAERFEVRSPVSGQVLKVLQESEAVVIPGAPLLEIGDPGQLEMVIDVLSSDAVAIVPGAAAAIERWGAPGEVAARVRSVEPRAFTKVSALGVEEQRVSVILDVVRAPDDWKRVGDGYRVLARIRTASVDGGVLVPVGALMRMGEGWEVFVADAGRAHRRSVRIGLRNSTHAAVTDGLRPGEQVIVYPPSSLIEGTRVAPRTPHKAQGMSSR